MEEPLVETWSAGHPLDQKTPYGVWEWGVR
jgi:hypothetical protein